jgi:hypothetical protein
MRTGSRSASALVVLVSAVLCDLVAPRSTSADWALCGRSVSAAPNSQVHSVMATDGAGGALIAWQDFRSARINSPKSSTFAIPLLGPARID